jgi:hypothetical protein
MENRLMHLNGNGHGNGHRSPVSRGKDFITVEKVDRAVNELCQNDANLRENQERLLGVIEQLVARVESLETRLSIPPDAV